MLIINQINKNVKNFVIVLFSLSIVFAFGFITGKYYEQTKLQVYTCNIKDSQKQNLVYIGTSSKYYYLPWCFSSIKNKIWITKEEAIEKGLKLAPYCK